MNETFELYMRSTDAPDHILQDEDVKRKVKACTSELLATLSPRGLTVDEFGSTLTECCCRHWRRRMGTATCLTARC